MNREFARSGVRIRYPDNWSIETEDTEEGWTVSIFSPDTAFLMLSHYDPDREPDELTAMALEAMRDSYPDLEAEPVVETMAGLLAVVGFDVDFIAFDLTNTCWIRALTGTEGNLLFMGQCTDLELDTNGQIMQAIGESLRFDEE